MLSHSELFLNLFFPISVEASHLFSALLHFHNKRSGGKVRKSLIKFNLFKLIYLSFNPIYYRQHSLTLLFALHFAKILPGNGFQSFPGIFMV